MMSINPKLAGQHEAYIHKQLVNFTTPQRNQAIMTTYSKMLTDDEKKNIAAYLSEQVPTPGAAKNAETLEVGKRIYRAGIVEKNVPACASCHGAGGAGIPAQYPRLAGQHQEYTASQLTLFRSGARNNNAAMTTIAMRMSDAEIKAVADYVAGLK
jgi:cytochrome c553